MQPAPSTTTRGMPNVFEEEVLDQNIASSQLRSLKLPEKAGRKHVFYKPIPDLETQATKESTPSNAGSPTRTKQPELERLTRYRHQCEVSTYRPLTKRDYAIRGLKCLGFGVVTVFFLIFATYAIVYGFNDEETREEVAFQIQQVLPGRLVSLSKNGLVAAIKDDFDDVQIYRKRNTTETTSPLWQPTGATLRSRGTVNISRNGTHVAFVDETTKRPQMWEYDPSLDEWENQDMPFAVGDDLSMDPDAILLILAVYNRGAVGESGASLNGDMDALITFKYDGTIWTKHADRLLISGMKSFEVSPTAKFMVICAEDEKNEGNTTEVHIVRLATTVDNGNVFERVDHVITLETSSPSVSFANDVFAVASPEFLEVFSYSGRTWGQALEPRENSTIESVALSLDGRTLAVGSVAKGNTTGAVDWFYFPFSYDTGDDWEIKGPPLTDEWELDEPPLRDEYGNESPMFGSEMELDGDGATIAVQSGTTGNENVHFYDVLLP